MALPSPRSPGARTGRDRRRRRGGCRRAGRGGHAGSTVGAARGLEAAGRRSHPWCRRHSRLCRRWSRRRWIRRWCRRTARPVEPPKSLDESSGVTRLVDQAAAEPPGEHPDAGRDGQEGAGRWRAKLRASSSRLPGSRWSSQLAASPARRATSSTRPTRHAVLVGGAGHRAELVGQLAQASRHAGLLGGGLVGEVAAGLAPQLAHLVLGLAGDLLGLLPGGLRDVPRRLLGLVSYGARSVRGGLRSGRLGLHEYPVLSSGRRRSTA